MATLEDTMEYLIDRYPKSWHLSNARLTKLVYLTDWVSAIRFGKQVTPVHWVFDNYGPFVWDILDTAKDNSDRFEVCDDETPYGMPKTLINLHKKHGTPTLTGDDIKAANHVINNTLDLGWDGFIRLVYSTHPVLTSRRYAQLDLVSKAREYVATNTSGAD